MHVTYGSDCCGSYACLGGKKRRRRGRETQLTPSPGGGGVHSPNRINGG